MIGWRFSDPGPNPLRDMFEQMLSERRRTGGSEWTSINVFEEEDAVVVTAMMPGVRPEDVEVHCSDNVLSVRGRSEVPERQYLHQEIRPTEYQRQIALPGAVMFDKAEANVENGVLTIRVPKVRPRAPEKIRIQVNRKDTSSSEGGRSR